MTVLTVKRMKELLTSLPEDGILVGVGGSYAGSGDDPHDVDGISILDTARHELMYIPAEYPIQERREV